MNPPLWIAAALVGAALAAAWAYGWREEPVPRRILPAVLRGLALFLLLAGLALPPLRSAGPPPAGRVALLDVSRSMTLPAALAGPGTRIDSARSLLEALGPDRVWLFGDTPVPERPDSARLSRPLDERSRVGPALEAARLAGADSVWVITDGEWDDRSDAIRTAERLGLGVREIRVSEPPARIGVADLRAPSRLRAGDTTRIQVEVAAGGERTALSDSALVELWADDVRVAAVPVAVPDPGRFNRAEVTFVPRRTGGEALWRRYEVRLVPNIVAASPVAAGEERAGTDPFAVADRRGFWSRVSDEATGVVVVSTDADWEARFLTPLLDRAVLGGATAFVRVGDDRYLEIGDRPRPAGDEAAIARSARAARLLVVQADFGELEEPLRAAIVGHPRKILLPRTPGPVPGTTITLGGLLSGDWYPAPPLPPGPAAGLIPELELEALPPLEDVYDYQGTANWIVLTGRRNRRGQARPLFVAGERGRSRWAVGTAAGYWRWAFRDGGSRRVYEGMIAGLAGWLTEDFSPRLVELDAGERHGESLSWRVDPAVQDLQVALLGESGDTIWTDSLVGGAERLLGPVVQPGRWTIDVRGTGPDGPISEQRPLEIAPDPRELLPRAVGPPLALSGTPGPELDGAGGRPRPVWPFLVAVLLLCGEWIWRQRIGLR